MKARRMIKVVSVTKEGAMTVHTRKTKVPTENVKERHYLKIPAEKQKDFWDFSKGIEAKVKAFKANQAKLLKENKELKTLVNKRAMSNVDKWFDNAAKNSI